MYTGAGWCTIYRVTDPPLRLLMYKHTRPFRDASSMMLSGPYFLRSKHIKPHKLIQALCNPVAESSGSSPPRLAATRYLDFQRLTHLSLQPRLQHSQRRNGVSSEGSCMMLRLCPRTSFVALSKARAQTGHPGRRHLREMNVRLLKHLFDALIASCGLK